MTRSADEPWRPRTRGDCGRLVRPCPFYACGHHLGVEVGRAGALRVIRDPDELAGRPSCALDLADDGRQSHATIAEALRMPEHHVRELEARALARVRDALSREHGKRARDLLDDAA